MFPIILLSRKFSMVIKNGILLAGGEGTRCQPFTSIYSKQLLFLSGKAVIDYPIQTLVDLGVENITIILGSSFAGQIIDYCGDGSKYNVNLNYIYQKSPDGISHAINLCKKFVINDNNFLVILGDNIYEKSVKIDQFSNDGACVFLAKNSELNRFGVASILDNNIVKIEEKPNIIDHNYSNYAITGLYLFDHLFFEYFSDTVKSKRREYEITDIINKYHINNKLNYNIIDGEWSDAGTIDKLNYLNYKLYNPT